MSDFSVNTDKINNLADLLDKQVKKLESYGNTVKFYVKVFVSQRGCKSPSDVCFKNYQCKYQKSVPDCGSDGNCS